MHNRPVEKSTIDVIKQPEGFALNCNGASLKTPAGANFLVPTSALAEAMAVEWRVQGEKVNHATMPFTQLAATALDILGRDRAPVVDQISAYAQSELLCHRAEAPQELADRQQRAWQPILDWCVDHYNVSLCVGAGVMPLVQPSPTVKALRGVIENYDNFRLVGLQQAVHVSGSLVLGLALAERHLPAAQVFDAAEIDATFQIEKWGEDTAITKRREYVKQDLEICERWFEALATSS